jgi:MFS family permease
MVGLLASSPVFAEAAKRAGAFRLIGAGLAVWAAAVTGCGLSVGFRSLLACRMAVGVGEASFVSLAAPFIDDHAPAHQKTRWLAAFFMCIPVGYALGFIYGGLMGGTWGWRAAFLLQAAAMLPFVAFCARAPHVSLRGTRPRGAAAPAAAAAEAGASAPAALLPARDALAARLREAAADVRQLGRRPVYAWVVAAMTCYTAVLGTLSFYGPQAARDVFGVDPQFVDLAFGALTVATGTLGTLAGGAALDAAGSSLRNGALLCCGGLAAGGALTVTAFSATSSFAAFACVLGLGQFALFMTAVSRPTTTTQQMVLLPALPLPPADCVLRRCAPRRPPQTRWRCGRCPRGCARWRCRCRWYLCTFWATSRRRRC